MPINRATYTHAGESPCGRGPLGGAFIGGCMHANPACMQVGRQACAHANICIVDLFSGASAWSGTHHAGEGRPPWPAMPTRESPHHPRFALPAPTPLRPQQQGEWQRGRGRRRRCATERCGAGQRHGHVGVCGGPGAGGRRQGRGDERPGRRAARGVGGAGRQQGGDAHRAAGPGHHR